MADTWTMLSGYTASDYVDTMVFEVVSATKKIRPLSGQTLVAGEKNSQYVRFEMDRFWDGIDISTKNFSITYSLAGKYYGTSEAVSAEVSTDKLRFGWIVPWEACCIAGTLMFVLVIKSDGYVLKTQIAETPVVKSLDEDSVVPEPTREAWYREFQARVQEDLGASQAALTSAQDAITRANAANDAASSALSAASEANLAAQDAIVVAKIRYGSPLVANAGPEMVDTNRVYVFTGSESAYTYGHWYYYDNGVWNDGGVYNGNSVNTDKTLSIENMPADAKATGDKIDALKEGLNEIEEELFSEAEIDVGTLSVGIYSTGTGQFNSNYNGYSNNTPFNASEYNKVTLECTGWVIRVLCLPPTGTTGFTYTEYTHDSVTVTITNALPRIGFTIRKTAGSNVPLTDAEKEEIASKLKVTGSGVSKLDVIRNDVALLDTRVTNVENELIKTYSDMDMFNGIYSSVTGEKVVTDSYKYGYSCANRYEIGENGSATVKCAGYAIRIYQFAEDSVASPTITDVRDSGTVFGNDDKTRIAFTVRKSVSVYDALTTEEMADIASKLTLEMPEFQIAEQSIKSINKELNKSVDALLQKVTGADIGFTNGIYSTGNASITTYYKYGLSNNVPILIGKNGLCKIECNGYYIRAFRLPETGTTGFDYNATYEPDALTVSGTNTLARIGITIRVDPSVSTALTEEQIEDIKSNLVVSYSPVINATEGVDEAIISATRKSAVIGSPTLYKSGVVTESGINTATINDLYARYDALCTNYPQWIKRQADIGNDSDGNPIRHYIVRHYDPIVGYSEAYTYESQEKVNYWESTFSYRRALINAGVHGMEKSATWGLIYFLEELLPSNDSWAWFIKANYCIDIIPVLCPWGFINDSRNNKNDVNVNRDYNTPDATKQPETLAITSYIQSIKDDIFCAIDLHCTSGNMNYIATHQANPALDVVMKLANQIIGSCVADWTEPMTEMGVTSTYYPYAYGCLSTNAGTLPHYMILNKITDYACTVECIGFDSDANRVKITRILKDEFVNMMQGFLALDK